MNIIAIAGAVLLLLASLKALLPEAIQFLPLGGSVISEIGIVFGVAVAFATLIELRGKNDP